jgi:hypothetical protein
MVPQNKRENVLAQTLTAPLTDFCSSSVALPLFTHELFLHVPLIHSIPFVQLLCNGIEEFG